MIKPEFLTEYFKGICINYFQNALKWLPSATDLKQEKKEQIKVELLKLLKDFEKSRTPVKHPSNESDKFPTCSYGRNNQMPSASDCVEMRYLPEMGRGLFATRDILPGKSTI